MVQEMKEIYEWDDEEGEQGVNSDNMAITSGCNQGEFGDMRRDGAYYPRPESRSKFV